jgi:hypothetical protein
MPDLPDKAERDPEYREELKRLRHERRRRVEEMLHSDVLDRAPGNAAYWIAVWADPSCFACCCSSP